LILVAHWQVVENLFFKRLARIFKKSKIPDCIKNAYVLFTYTFGGSQKLNQNDPSFDESEL
jgi:hypothetical protein